MNTQEWRKSSRSTNGAECVELRVRTGEIRDTKNRAAGSLKLSAGAFRAFIDQVKRF